VFLFLGFPCPFNERHVKLILNLWIPHYNHGRPHMSLVPGIPVPLPESPPEHANRQRIAAGRVIAARRFLAVCIMNTIWEEVAA
jgi:hypothetical protein